MAEGGGIEPLSLRIPQFSRLVAGHSAAPSDWRMGKGSNFRRASNPGYRLASGRITTLPPILFRMSDWIGPCRRWWLRGACGPYSASAQGTQPPQRERAARRPPLADRMPQHLRRGPLAPGALLADVPIPRDLSNADPLRESGGVRCCGPDSIPAPRSLVLASRFYPRSTRATSVSIHAAAAPP